jgi:hypothetical protein
MFLIDRNTISILIDSGHIEYKYLLRYTDIRDFITISTNEIDRYELII